MNNVNLHDMQKTDNYRLTFFDGITEIYYDDDTMDIAREIAFEIIHENGLILHGVRIDIGKLTDENLEYLRGIFKPVCKAYKKTGVNVQSYVDKAKSKEMIRTSKDGIETMHYQDDMVFFHEFLIGEWQAKVNEIASKIQVVLNMARLLVKTNDNLKTTDFIDAFQRMQKYAKYVDGID